MNKYYSRILVALPVLAMLIVFSSFSFPFSNSGPLKIKLNKISVKHLDWDQIVVNYNLIDEGAGNEITPDQTIVRVFNHKGKLISQSYGKRVLLNDAELGSEEVIKVEIEVTAGSDKATHTETLKASKKQLNFNPLIVYPLKKQLYAGAYSVSPKLMRVKFGTQSEYEQVETDLSGMKLFLTVKDEQGSKKIAVPVKQGSAKFRLDESPQYDDFKPVLETAIAEYGGTTVKFAFAGFWNDKYYEEQPTDVHLAFSGVSVRRPEQPQISHEHIADNVQLKSNTIVLGSLTEIQKYARSYAAKVSETYRVVPESLQVKINDWQFDVTTNLYVAEVAINWNNAFAKEEQYSVKGTLTVDKQGKHPAFQRTYANHTILDVEKYNKTERAMASVR